jgi:steroid delta-isomerase-like uncharacterized protein
MNPLEQKFECWNSRDFEGAAACYTEDGTHHDQTLGVTWTAKEVAEFTKAAFDTNPELRFEIVNSFQTDSFVAGELIMHGRFENDMGDVKATGKPLKIHFACFGEIRDGKIYRMTDYYNKLELTGEA